MVCVIKVRLQIDVILLIAYVGIDLCEFLSPHGIGFCMESIADVFWIDGHEREEDRSDVVCLAFLFDGIEIGDDLIGADLFGAQTVRSREYQEIVGMEVEDILFKAEH